MKYDESDNLFVRATRTVTDKLGDIFRKCPRCCTLLHSVHVIVQCPHRSTVSCCSTNSEAGSGFLPGPYGIIFLFFSTFLLLEDVFSQSEMAKTLAEITKIDPSFNKENFLHECEYEIIPTVLQVDIHASF